MSKQTINSSVRNLEKQGFIYLKQGIGREKNIFLTDMGRGFVEEKIRPVIEIENDAFLEMEPEERREFIRLSQKYVDGFARKEKRLLEELI